METDRLRHAIGFVDLSSSKQLLDNEPFDILQLRLAIVNHQPMLVKLMLLD